MNNSADFQKEVSEMSADLAAEDELGAVVRTQIRIEALLNEFAELKLQNPTQLTRLRLDYDQLVSLCIGLGMELRLEKPLRSMGRIRNSFAHRLGAHLNSDAASNLYETLCPEDKEVVQQTFLRIKDDNESTRMLTKFEHLGPADRFKIVALTIWSATKAILIQQAR